MLVKPSEGGGEDPRKFENSFIKKVSRYALEFYKSLIKTKYTNAIFKSTTTMPDYYLQGEKMEGQFFPLVFNPNML